MRGNLALYDLLPEDALNALQLLTAPEQVLLPHAIRHLRALMDRHKREGGVIDFDDMIRLTREALDEAPALVNVLRAQYRVALVDEFQIPTRRNGRSFARSSPACPATG